jgi:hypothetical protein
MSKNKKIKITTEQMVNVKLCYKISQIQRNMQIRPLVKRQIQR